MSCVSEELRPQAVAISIFFMHLFGDFPSPFLIGAINESAGMYWGTIITVGWLVFCIFFWLVSFNFAVIFMQRFHGAPFSYMKKNFFSKNIVVPTDVERLLSTDKESKKSELNGDGLERYPNKSVNKSLDKEMD